MRKSDFLKKLRRTILISMPGGVLSEEKMAMIDTMADNILETMELNGIKPPKWFDKDDAGFTWPYHQPHWSWELEEGEEERESQDR